MPWKFLDILSSVLLFIFFAWFTAEYSNLLKNLKEKLQKKMKRLFTRKRVLNVIFENYFSILSRPKGTPGGYSQKKFETLV